jgi:hypothetical protein
VAEALQDAARFPYPVVSMHALAIGFLLGTGLLWLSVYGYALALGLVAARRRARPAPASDPPEIAVVIATLNEEDRILARLADLRRTDYPRDRMSVIVVDGGSTDDTTARVQGEIDRGEPIGLVRLEGARGKMEQIRHALEKVDAPIAVITDADAALEPSCIRELVGTLQADPRTAVVGAVVRPVTGLIEERIHWWILNRLWSLEGEALSSAGISGLCYAIRWGNLRPLVREARAEDAHVALVAGAHGFRVRTCPSAIASELRVPQRPGELVRFRRRRGEVLIHELLHAAPGPQTPVGWRLARAMRLWHFLWAPRAAAGLLAVGVPLAAWGYGSWIATAVAAFAAPPLVALYASPEFASERRPWWRLAVASARLGMLTAGALVALRPPWRRAGRGGRS